MKVVQEKIGNSTVCIQVIDDSLEILGNLKEEPNIVDTGIEEDAKDVYKKAKNIIQSIAEDIGTKMDDIKEKARPKQTEIEFKMGFSAQAGVWILGVKNDYTLKVKMVWQSETNG